MNWQEEYRGRRMSAAQALKFVRSGDRVWIQPSCGTPKPLIDALVARSAELFDVELVHMKTLGEATYTRPEYEGHFRHRGLFLGDNVREAVAAGRADYTPIFLSEIEGLFESGALPLDVVLMQVSPPDAHGFVSLSTTVDCTMTAARCAKTVIAEVNDRAPRTHGDTSIHVSQISAFVETSRQLLELPTEPFSEMQMKVGRNVATLIPDGATLQPGIGGISEAVLHCLQDKHDLGIHTEMCPDGVVDLMEAGIINGARKSLHRGKAVAAFVLGTQKLFDYIHENPSFEFRSISYTNDPFVVAQNDRMVAINSALQIDLTGQVCADSLGTKPYSGFGGQLDFIRGAARSRGGVPIIALLSTACRSAISRIVPVLEPGAGVVTSRADVHYVVTEHGVAYLHGKTLRERSEALIAIADPRFQQELQDFAVRAHYLKSQTAAYA
ncbi:acetyl-CoA hydrolase/transferase C-terminal domain-containing protein [Telmatobacter sp. DSM 110680]|uniref:Acetyl-CoA hydrolase/transferase C-terminal domain-containing protein n=1 Tax=Telmatobacter sp. DSM 110680 TaxID=3036704 RepID=A0AAU7DPU0_9BACT